MKYLYRLLCALSVVSISCTYAEENIQFKSTPLSPGMVLLEGVGGFAGGNILLSIGKDGVFMIDDSMPPLLDTLNKKIEEVAGKPIDFLINTHVHADHTGNNVAFAEQGAHIIAHENLRANLLEKGVPGKNGLEKAPKGALPVITFSQHLALHFNDVDAHLVYLGRAHTNGDTVVHFTGANIIHAGDVLFNGMFPYIDLGNGGSTEGYIAAQKMVYDMADDKTKIIAGHGPLANKSDLKASIEMLEDARKRVQALIDKGLSEDEIVAKNPLEKYHEKWNWSFISTEKMTRTFYKGLTSSVKLEKVEKVHYH